MGSRRRIRSDSDQYEELMETVFYLIFRVALCVKFVLLKAIWSSHWTLWLSERVCPRRYWQYYSDYSCFSYCPRSWNKSYALSILKLVSIEFILDQEFHQLVEHPCMRKLKSRSVWVHVDMPGQEYDSLDLPPYFEFPSFDKICRDLIEVLNYFKWVFFVD